MYYRQCELTQDNTKLVTWIPESGAVLGYSMELTDRETKTKRPGRWTVTSVSNQRVEQSFINDRLKIYARYRSHTDV